MQSIKFKNGNLNLAGNLFLPEGFNAGSRYAAIVCAHPAGGVKEQTAGLYAQKLAQKGFVTLAFDAAYQGESEGLPRGLEDPEIRVEDIRCAVDYLTTLDFVDPERIGAFGVCAGGGYAINATMGDRRIKAVAGASPADIGAFFRKGWEGNAPESALIELMDNVARQRAAEVAGAEPLAIRWIPDLEDIAVPEFREAYEYYRTPRGMHPNSTGRLMFTASIAKLVGFSAFDRLETLLTRPLLLIAGSRAGTLWMSEEACARAAGPKRLHIVDGASHVDMYDKAVYVDEALAQLADFFEANLAH